MLESSHRHGLKMPYRHVIIWLATHHLQAAVRRDDVGSPLRATCQVTMNVLDSEKTQIDVPGVSNSRLGKWREGTDLMARISCATTRTLQATSSTGMQLLNGRERYTSRLHQF